MASEHVDDTRRGLPSACPLPGNCTALADGARTGEYGRCWCRGDEQVRVRWFDLASPLFAAVLALVATLLTGFFVLSSTWQLGSVWLPGPTYRFWGWPLEWRTNVPLHAMREVDSVDVSRWQEPGFDRGTLILDCLAWFAIIFASYVALRLLCIILRVAARRIIVAQRLSTHRQA
jgi:hypothetical protein